MRVALQNNELVEVFSKRLSDTGNGKMTVDMASFTSSKEELITKMFSNIVANQQNHKIITILDNI